MHVDLSCASLLAELKSVTFDDVMLVSLQCGLPNVSFADVYVVILFLQMFEMLYCFCRCLNCYIVLADVYICGSCFKFDWDFTTNVKLLVCLLLYSIYYGLVEVTLRKIKGHNFVCRVLLRFTMEQWVLFCFLCLFRAFLCHVWSKAILAHYLLSECTI